MYMQPLNRLSTERLLKFVVYVLMIFQQMEGPTIYSNLWTAEVFLWEIFLFFLSDIYLKGLALPAEWRPQLEKWILYNFVCWTNQESIPGFKSGST